MYKEGRGFRGVPWFIENVCKQCSNYDECKEDLELSEIPELMSKCIAIEPIRMKVEQSRTVITFVEENPTLKSKIQEMIQRCY